MKIQLSHNYVDIIGLNNLYKAWEEFVVGKANKDDVQLFALNLFDNVAKLHDDLLDRTYKHSGYYSFFINDPKRRHIHKAEVRDRLLHHAIHRKLYPFFDRTFLSDSYSCRLGRGVYKAIESFDVKSHKVSKNNTKSCWVLKCDIKKFFDSINHTVLLNILADYIPDQNIIWLLSNVIDSYHNENMHGVGLPLGNLTSQLFANVYMNVFDQWMKHTLKAEHYIRYADDFVIFSNDKYQLEDMIEPIREFLSHRLCLILHPTKTVIKTYASGIDFLGWVHFPNYKKLRVKTKQRMFRKLTNEPQPEIFQSYLGLLTHGNTFKIESELRNAYWLLNNKSEVRHPPYN
ncbi:MAG: reverse transcriptase/maturase family protein [Patescibacteria group bacterium]